MLKNLYRLSLIISSCLFSLPALAVTLPWDSRLQTIVDGLSGKTTHLILLITIMCSALGFAVGEHGGMMRKALGIVFAGSVAVGAGSVAATMGWI